MTPISGNVAIAVAQLELSVVQLLRQAIRTADLSTAGSSTSANPSQGVVTDGVGTNGGTAVDYRIERNEVDFRFNDAAVTYEPRDYRHVWQQRAHTDRLAPYTDQRPITPTVFKSPIDPPWKSLQYPIVGHGPIVPVGHSVIKCDGYTTDVSSVGRTLDLFV